MERRKFDTENLETLIHIEGKNSSLEEIAEMYIEKMEEGFNLTVEEMATYLKCSYRHALKLQPHIRHIVIDQHVGRKSLILHKQDHKYSPLFTNRKLFFRSDFEKYILNNAELVTTYRRYMISDFDPRVIQHLADNLEKEFPQHFLGRMLSIAHRNVPSDANPQKVEKLDSLPDELHSVTSLLKSNVWTHERYIYHFLRDHGVKKVRIGNMIRYRRDDLANALEDDSDLVGTAPLACKKADVIRFVESQALRIRKG